MRTRTPMTSRALALALGLLFALPAAAQTSQLNPFRFQWTESLGTNGQLRPLEPYPWAHYVQLTTWTGTDYLRYAGNPIVAGDGLSASYDIIANRPVSGDP